jgi:hypothetical protein
VVYEGARRLIRVEEARLTLYSIYVTLIILACPILLNFVFSKLAVALN